MQETKTSSEEMIEIPTQSWYGLVIHDLTPEQINDFFLCVDSAIVDPEDMIELCEAGLSYISDVFVDMSHDSLFGSNSPNTERLKKVADELEKQRKYWIVQADKHTIGEDVEDYLGDNYTKA
jgi:hypothetical protein